MRHSIVVDGVLPCEPARAPGREAPACALVQQSARARADAGISRYAYGRARVAAAYAFRRMAAGRATTVEWNRLNRGRSRGGKMRHLKLLDVNKRALTWCRVDTRRTRDRYAILLEGWHGRRETGESGVDFDGALVDLREKLERAGLRLLCNRFHRAAFVSPLARQLSDGLSCYLVSPGVLVRPAQLVPSLAPASADDVVSMGEGAAYIEDWYRTFAHGSSRQPALARGGTRWNG